jgi:hypothetical protein
MPQCYRVIWRAGRGRGFSLGEYLWPLDAALTPDTGLCVTNEWGVGTVPEGAVDTHGAGPDSACHLERPILIAGDDLPGWQR